MGLAVHRGMPTPEPPLPLLARALRFARSVAVGGIATLVDLAVLTTLVELVHLSPEAANVPSLLAGLLVQFVGNRHFVFRAGDGHLGRQLGAFVATELMALVLNAVLFALAVAYTPIPYPIVRLLGELVVYVGFSYPLWKRVFASPSVTSS